MKKYVSTFVIGVLVFANCLASQPIKVPVLQPLTVKAGEIVPFDGVLLTRDEAIEEGAFLALLEEKVLQHDKMEILLDQEQRRCNRWYKKPAFWIPAVCVSFVVGLCVGVGF